MATSLVDIARRLELSPSTVSKALNGYRDVAGETREQVLRAALELDYQPRAAARNLRRGRTDRIGLFLNTSIEYVVDYLSGIIAGAVRCSQDCGKRLLIYTLTNNDPRQLLQVCRAGEIDGVILFSTHYDSHTIETLLAERFPFVVMGRQIEDERVFCVVPDYYEGTRQAMAYLLGKGHRRIAFMTRPELSTANEARLRGYRDGLAAAGIAVDETLIVETRLQAESGVAPTRQLLALAQRPTAICAFHDLVAVDVITTLQEAGLRVPRDVAVMGFDGLRAGFRTLPHISTVQQPLERIGERVVALVDRQLQEPEATPVQETLAVQLIPRGSA